MRSGLALLLLLAPLAGRAAVAGRVVSIARVVTIGTIRPDAAAPILLDALRQLPAGTRAQFLLTPGGFAEAPLPANWSGRSGWASRPEDGAALVAAAEPALARALTPGVLVAAQGKADFIAIGVDVVGDKGMEGPHAELVALFDVGRRRAVAWTGKSYPTRGQETRLVSMGLETHFVRAGGGRVLLLGCNDLNLFNPRAWKAASPGSPRGAALRAMDRLVGPFSPTLILQLPHATDTPNTWRNSWLAAARRFPALEAWASGIRYLRLDGAPRRPLEQVLALTRSSAEDVLELLVDASRHASRPSRYLAGARRF